MNKLADNVVKFTNADSSFTELFSILKRYQYVSSGMVTLSYSSDELKVLYQHIDNAVDVLLQGTQSLGYLMGTTEHNNLRVIKEFKNIGFFLSLIANLKEALNVLRSDADFVLQQRGVTNY